MLWAVVRLRALALALPRRLVDTRHVYVWVGTMQRWVRLALSLELGLRVYMASAAPISRNMAMPIPMRSMNNSRRRRVHIQVRLLGRRREEEGRPARARALFRDEAVAGGLRRRRHHPTASGRGWRDRRRDADAQGIEFGFECVYLCTQDAVLMAERLLVVSRQCFAVVFDPYTLGAIRCHQMCVYEYKKWNKTHVMPCLQTSVAYRLAFAFCLPVPLISLVNTKRSRVRDKTRTLSCTGCTHVGYTCSPRCALPLYVPGRARPGRSPPFGLGWEAFRSGLSYFRV